MSFKEPGSVRYEMIDGKKVPIIECEAEITVINKKTHLIKKQKMILTTQILIQ